MNVQYADSNVVMITARKIANENSELLARLGDDPSPFLEQIRATPAYGSPRAPSPKLRKGNDDDSSDSR